MRYRTKTFAATPAQIRAHYKTQGHDVRITKGGRVTYRTVDGQWLEGRWVSEYRVIKDKVVLV